MARWYDHYDGIVVGILRFRRPLLLGAGGVRADEMGPGTDPPAGGGDRPQGHASAALVSDHDRAAARPEGAEGALLY